MRQPSPASAYNKATHSDDVDAEKQQEAQHRALSGLTKDPSAGPSVPSLAPAVPAVAPPAAPPANPLMHRFFPGVMKHLGTPGIPHAPRVPGVPKMMADGGKVPDAKDDDQKGQAQGQWVNRGSDPDKRKEAADSLAKAFGMADGGKVPTVLSPGEKVLSPESAETVAEASKALEHAPKVPGKAEVKGDSPKNDKVPAEAPSGGVVIPRSLAEKGDATELMAFVAKALGRK